MGYYARLTRELKNKIIIDEQPLKDDKISSVKFLNGTDIVEIYKKEMPEDKNKPIIQLPEYKKFYVGNYYRYEDFKQKHPSLINVWGDKLKTWDGVCQTLSEGTFHAIPDRENYPVLEPKQISGGKYYHSHGDKTYYVKFYKKNLQQQTSWTERLESLRLEDLEIEEGVYGFKIYAKDDSWKTVDEKNYIIGRLAKENEILQAGYNPQNNSNTYLLTSAGVKRMGEKNFIVLSPENIKEGRYVEDKDNNITIKYYRKLKGGGESHWERDDNVDDIESVVFKQGLYRVKFCYKLKDGAKYDEQEFILGREISSKDTMENYPDVYEKYKDRNPIFVETPYGATIVRCAKCTIIAPEKLVNFKYDPYKDKDYVNLE